jgi:hypothetical protein
MSLTELLSRKIKEADPALDIFGADRKVFQTACQDFSNYLKFSCSIANKETNIFEYTSQLEQSHKTNPAEIESFLTVWCGMWLKKWKERVNLLLEKDNGEKSIKTADPEVAAKAESKYTNLDCREEMLGILTTSLIKNGEICGTRLIADNILKTELRKKIDKDINSKEQVLAILNNSLRRAREVSQRTGPLISIKVDKKYYCQVNN